MREIVLDTETTGLDPLDGHRLVEIGCIELINGIPTGQTFHRYFNPERGMPEEAYAVHGLSEEFLKDKMFFAEAADDLIAFLGDAPLVIHNAAFDLGFINAELERAGRPPVTRERLVDTLLIARRKHPGGSNRLDDLCVRYAIDNSRRTKHDWRPAGAAGSVAGGGARPSRRRTDHHPRAPGAAGAGRHRGRSRGASDVHRHARRARRLARVCQFGLSGGDAGWAAARRWR
jgi:DNA polymerase III epsilon subunit family exonuclease